MNNAIKVNWTEANRCEFMTIIFVSFGGGEGGIFHSIAWTGVGHQLNKIASNINDTSRYTKSWFFASSSCCLPNVTTL